MDTTNLKVWLPFDNSPTEDLCANTWTAYGNPIIANGALKLPGNSSYLAMSGGVTLGGQNFTVSGQFNISSSTGTYSRVFSLHKTANSLQNALYLYRYSNSQSVGFCLLGTDYYSHAITFGRTYHFEFDYDHAAGKLYFFLDGVLQRTVDKSITRITFDYCWLGRSNYSADGYFVGTIDEFMIHDGVALHTKNFTPPTAEDYQSLAIALIGHGELGLNFDIERRVNNIVPVELTVDVERKIQAKWRYINLGTADTLTVTGTTLTDLPADKSRTSSAFYQTTRAKCFDLPTTSEVWLKFDVYFDGSNRWRAYNGGTNGVTGITAQTHNGLSYFSNGGSQIYGGAGVCKTNQLQTVLLHMISGSSAGVIEAWVDGAKIYRYTGDVNHGEDFADIYLQSDGAGTFFSNVIISNVEIGLGDGYQSITADVERKLANRVEVTADVERRVKQVVAVELAVDVEVRDVLPVAATFDTERRITNPVELAADVEVHDVVPVEVIADIARNLLTNLNLQSNDGVADSDGLQSISITIAEQQITDAVKIVAAIEFDIMYPIRGLYLDYVFDMRAERVTRRGVLYDVDCCTDLDALLYTQMSYTLKQRTTWYQSDTDGNTQEIKTYYPPASMHVEKIAAALGLTPVMQFDDFLSTVLMDDLGGVTYADLIRDIFGWSSRVPTMLINAYIRGRKLFVIQRGHEANVVNITGADMTLPTITRELVRTTWGASPWSATQVVEKLGIKVPDDVVVSGGDSGSGDSGGGDSGSGDSGGGDSGSGDSGGGDSGNEHVAEAKTTIHGIDMEGHTIYRYNGKGLLSKVHSYSRQLSTGDTTYTTVNHNYDSDGTVTKTRTVTTNTNHNDDGSIETIETESVNEKNYITLSNGEKFLASEHSVKYENGILVDEQIVTHSPTRVGQSHSITQSSSGIVGEATGQNTGDDRVTPFSEAKAASLLNKLPDKEQIIEGLPLFDASFPIHNEDMLIAVTNELKRLNRKTCETVTLSLYNFSHLIDFNDRVILNGAEYYLVSNSARTTSRIGNEQALTLRRWF